MKYIKLSKDFKESERFPLNECTIIEAKSADGSLFSIQLSDFSNGKRRSVIIDDGDGTVDINIPPMDFIPTYFQLCFHQEPCKVSYRIR